MGLRDSLGSLLAYLGPLLGSLGQLLGISWNSLIEALGNKQQQDSNKVPQDNVKSCPRDKKGAKTDPPKTNMFMSFLGPFLDSLRNSLSEGCLDASWPKN